MHDWAQTVEAFSGLIGKNYKQDGDHLVQQYLRAESDILSALDTGDVADPDAVAIVGRLRSQVASFIDNHQAEPEQGES